MSLLQSQLTESPRSSSFIAIATTALVCIAALACYEPTKPAPQALTITGPDTGTADGASLTTLTIRIDSLTPLDKRAVAITTTAGTFTAAASGGATTLAPDQDGKAVALLRAPGDSTTALITATVNGATATKLVIFRRALPDALTIETSQYVIASTNTADVTVTANLFRAVGTPSAPLSVTFSASDTSTLPSTTRAVFLPSAVQSNALGVAKTRFVLADTAYRGPLVIRATVAPSGVTSTAIVQVVGPASSKAAP